MVKTIRAVARNILGPRLATLVRQEISHVSGLGAYYRRHLRGKRGLEIGGPSPTLGASGLIPIYDVLGSLDNCLYGRNTIWTGDVREGKSFVYDPGKAPGAQIICDGTDLAPVQNSSYDCVLSCHSLEHVANPIRALAEWKRVLKVDGLFLLILPHKDGTFDWRRPVTPLAHMIEDFEKGTGEDDLTHLSEIVELHDLSKDQASGTKEQFRERCLQNHINRAMHHHVFDTRSALALVDHLGFKILRVDTLEPFHIVILAGRSDSTPDNSRLMDLGGNHWRRSPFPSDDPHRKR